jgi:hypothetical protein
LQVANRFFERHARQPPRRFGVVAGLALAFPLRRRVVPEPEVIAAIRHLDPDGRYLLTGTSRSSP